MLIGTLHFHFISIINLVVFFQLEQAQDATEKRKVMENEREITADRVEKYKQQAEKEQQRIEQLTEMHKSFYCELCDRQYTKYSEWDNHINSYSHHHNQVRKRVAGLILYSRKFSRDITKAMIRGYYVYEEVSCAIATLKTIASRSL